MQRLTKFLVAAAAAMLLAVPQTASAATVFADEFNAGPLNTGAWKVELPWGTQWNNREQMWYDPANISFVNGGMRFKTEKRSTNGYPYASGVATTRNRYGYGYFEVRAKLPKGRGVWPAIWLLKDGGTAAEPAHELDIMELLGHEPNKVYMTYHRSGGQVYQARYVLPTGDFSQAYHTFAVDWQPTYIRWYVDGVQRGEYTGTIYASPQNIILNTAVGDSTSWPGAPDGTTVMPQYMDIDYVRVFPSKAAASQPVSFPSTISYSRIEGSDRYGTAVAVSKKAFPSTAPAAVIAYGGNYPDSLAAGPLAKAYGGPVLLTPTSGLTPAVLAELKRLAPSKVFVIGSTNVVGSAVERQLAGLASPPSVTRLGGADRYETAGLVADALKAKVGAPARVVVANGYADALSIGPLAAAKGWPILMTTANSLPRATAAAVARTGAGSSLVIGSTSVISDAVARSLPSATRLGGKDRYETCAAVADFAVGQGSSYGRIALATGRQFPDGLVSAPYLANGSGLLLLTTGDSVPASIKTRMTANKAAVRTVNSLGSAACLSESVVYEAASALK